MVGQKLLLVGALSAALVLPATAHEDASCTAAEWAAGLCSTGSISGDHVDVGASGGSDGNSGGNGASDDEASDDTNAAAPAAGNPCPPGAACAGNIAVQVQGVTMSALASFYPQKPTIFGEPNGWAIIGLDANFVSSAAQHTASGSLVGQPATVRFTPVRFLWDYGDGARVSTATGGATWRSLGVPEFSPTPTSHVYTAGGSYGVALTVEYSAQYRIGGGPWQDVPGTLRLSAPTFTVIAADAKTVLVQRNCQADPRGPGC
ncbi:hypothetical protein [Humibacter sp.]|uniref:hypothetical protein n=1 Tax=Humibacter sp. TaxID=1940291 RepID=UPI003F7CD6DB